MIAYGNKNFFSSLNKKIMILDKYKRQYKFKSRQGNADKYLWVSIIGALVICAIIYYFF